MRLIPKRALLAILFIMAGALLIFLTSAVSHAQDDPPAKEYAGEGECSDCHRDLSRPHEESPHGLALIDATDEDNEDFVIGDFSADDATRMVTFPDGESRPLEQEDIAFALGMGRYAQRYLYEIGENDYAVLPLEWNVAAEAWQPYGSAENWATDPAYNFGQSCAGCHTTGYDVETKEWVDNAVQCEACHGPGSVHIEIVDDAGNRPNDEELLAIRGAIVRSPDAQICGQCHSQGTEPSANHPFPLNYQPGEDLLAEDTFVLVAEDSANHWWGTGHAAHSNMQFNEWLNSAHASALTTMKESSEAEDACLTCHSGDYRMTQRLIQQVEDGDRDGDPLPALTLDTAEFGITCTTCHNVHLESEDDIPVVSYLPPDSSYTLCVECHSATDVTDGIHHPVQQMFEGQVLVEAVEGIPSPHFADEEGPVCTTCHMPRLAMGDFELPSHDLNPVLPDPEIETPQSACETCHDLNAQDLQFLVEDVQTDILDRITADRARLASIPELDPESDEALIYQHVNDVLTFVQNDGSLGIHNYQYADALLSFAERQIVELSVPNASFSPTEAPMPTATPGVSVNRTAPASEVEATSGNKPIVWVIAILSLLILGGVAFIFFRKQES